MDDATGLAEALLGLCEFKVLAVAEFPDELWISVETTADVVGCPRCAGPGSGPRTQAGRHQGPALFRPSSPPDLVEASLALRRW